MVIIYSNLCEPCRSKHSVIRDCLVFKEIKSSDLNSKYKVINTQLQEVEDNVYQDHLTDLFKYQR